MYLEQNLLQKVVCPLLQCPLSPASLPCGGRGCLEGSPIRKLIIISCTWHVAVGPGEALLNLTEKVYGVISIKSAIVREGSPASSFPSQYTISEVISSLACSPATSRMTSFPATPVAKSVIVTTGRLMSDSGSGIFSYLGKIARCLLSIS